MNGNRSIVYREFVGVIPVAKTLRNELRPVGQTQEHPAVAVSLRVKGFFPFQAFQPLFQLLPQGGGHEDGAAGRRTNTIGSSASLRWVDGDR